MSSRLHLHRGSVSRRAHASLPTAGIGIQSRDAICITALLWAGEPAVISEGFEASADAAVGVVSGEEEEEEDGEHDGGGYAVADAVVALGES